MSRTSTSEAQEGRAIVHLDGDAFFAAVEQAADPRLRGKAMAVGGERRGVITSASYEARKLGVKAAMPTVHARKLCPGLIVVPGDFDRYEQFSRLMFSYAGDHTPLVEVQGLDEGYYDLTPNRARPPDEIALTVQRAIRQALKITVSEGLATSKLVSQIASKAHKPAGFRVIPPGEELAFLHPLPHRWLPGVGPALAARLNAAGLAEIRHIATMPAQLLELVAGSQARQLILFARGIDDRPVLSGQSQPQKTYSVQQTFRTDLTDEAYAEAALHRMADELFAKVRHDRRAVRTLTVTVKYNDHDQSQVSESLREPTNLETDVYGRLAGLLKRAWERRVSLRMVGLKLSNVYEALFAGELDLPGEGASRERRERAVIAVEKLRHQFGPSAVVRGHDFVLRDGPADPTPVEAARPQSPQRLAIHVRRPKPVSWIPLGCHSHYSFLDSTLSPTRIVALAESHGLPAIALSDLGNLHGAGEFATVAKERGIRPIIGAELTTHSGPLYLFVQNATGYRNLCRVLSRDDPQRPDRAAEPDVEAAVALRQRLPFGRETIAAHAEGLIAVTSDDRFEAVFGSRFHRAITHPDQADHPRGVIVPRTHYEGHAERRHFEIIQSIRTRTLLQHAHPDKRRGDFSFRVPAQLPEWCLRHPELLRRTQEIADACEFTFPFGPPQFPAFHPPDGSTTASFLRRLVREGLQRRYGRESQALRAQVEEELRIITNVGYEALFLHTWSLLQDCRAAGIEWITRGSAADSLVCYCLGISNVCPIRFELYFKRFLNQERMAMHKLPDIDIDFPHDRKDEVIEMMFRKFGPDHCAIVGGFSTFQARSAFGDVAKVLGISEGQVRRFTERFPWGGGTELRAVLERGIETRGLPLGEEPYRTALELAGILDGRPRHPKMHPCGVVLTRVPVHSLTPTFRSNKGWPTTHFDMDITESMGLVKMDVLAQGGLAVLRDARVAIRRNHAVEVDLESLAPWNDPHVWNLIASGGARAVHHIESPAMLNLARMTRVHEIDGLIALVSVIRPGAANEGKKSAFARRYQGVEPPSYAHPSLEPCLRSTFGLVVFEEHILQIAETYAGLSAGRGDLLRRALVRQIPRLIDEMELEFFAGAAAKGHPLETTREVWELVSRFQGYAFNKAHSTAYGVEAFEAAWVKDRYPAEFLAGVLTHGKGFYSRLVYVLECHRLGLRILPPTINEPGPGFIAGAKGIRVPVSMVKQLRAGTVNRILGERQRRPFTDLPDFVRRVGPDATELENLVRVGAFDEFGGTRLQQFWDVQQLVHGQGHSRDPAQGWLLPAPTLESLASRELCEPSPKERLQAEWDLLEFTVSAHPLELFDDIHWSSYCPLKDAGRHVGREITVCGLVIEQRIHHQVTGEPMKFLTIADRSEIASTDLFAETYRSYGLATVRYPVLEVTAKVEPFENGAGWTLRALRVGKPRVLPSLPALA